ncbi:MAG: hypothetical protein OXF84_13140 [Bacteroidetes bacterium]|nr:hypothetical protein [Bacteroidota bacterium]
MSIRVNTSTSHSRGFTPCRVQVLSNEYRIAARWAASWEPAKR